uniref:protein unc-93 homolog A-like isoform X2 n=1 Tax=Ciona intestinalis TaxID=7719 RepID=UPI000EF4EBC8|nr:protein unc-93 homolog A-like isoform X2 [Ciona intestinalis]|eukprot:XP_026689820.1 protein unc-93 homolog A-like isoform X2 [Ciona intestinalis]
MFIITLSARDLKIGGKAMDESSVMNCDAAVSENSDCKPETRERSMSRYLYILGLTAMFIYGSYSGVIGLESSINIEGGLGTTSVMIVFIVSSFSCIFLLPIVIDFLGPKFAIILGELGFVAYIASNFYPSWYTLIPAAVVHGITESGMWAGGSCYVTFLAKKQWEKETRRNEDSGRSQEALIYRYFGIYYSMLFCGEAIFLPEASVKEDQTRGESILPTTTSSIKKENSATQSPTKTNRVLTKVKVELKGTFRHVISPLHLFIAPYIFYNGLYYAYEITEYTRAFVSCSIGVEKLGLATGVLGAFTISGTTFGGHVLYRLGRTKYAIVVTCWHLGTFLCSNFWQPHPNNTWVIYLLGAFLGFGQGILNNMLKGLTAHYFQGTEVVAFSVKNCITNLGIVAGTAWSTSLCVYEKIYVVIGFLLFSLVCFFIAERLFQKQKKTICM